MKLETSINSFEEILLDMKVFGKIMRENEHVNIGKTNRLARLGEFSQPPLKEQLCLSISECIRADISKNRYELNYNVKHIGSFLPRYETYKFSLSELRDKLCDEYRFSIKELRCNYEEYKFNIQDLRSSVKPITVYKEYRFKIQELRDVETMYKEYRFSIIELRKAEPTYEEYRYSIKELRKPILLIEEYRYNIVELRKPLTKIVEHRYNINDLRKPLTQVVEYRYKLSELRHIEPVKEVKESLIKESIPTEFTVLEPPIELVAEDVITQSNNSEVITVKEDDDLDIDELLQEQAELEDYLAEPNTENSTRVEESEGYLVEEKLQEKKEISADVSSNNSPDSIINTESNNIAKEKDKPLDIPTDLVKFVKMYPRCDIEFALEYFSKEEIDKALKIAKISKKKNKLYL